VRVVIQSDARIWGGNEKWLVMVGEGLAARGHDVLVSCRAGAPVSRRAAGRGLRVTHRRPGADADLFRALGFLLMLRREHPDVVLLTAFKRSFWGGWAARRARVARVVERMGVDQGLPDRWKYRHAFRHYIDGMIVNSADIKARWLASAPWFPEHEVHVVLNGVRRPAAEPGTLRAELGLAADVPLVMGAGRLEERKGFDVLLDAFARVPLPAARLAIAGDGRAEAALRSQAEGLGIADRVHWLGFRPELPTLLLDGDVFALPSRKEGMANVMLEAMAGGALVVATDISGVREALDAREGRPAAGWIVPPDDAVAMGAALTEALTGLRDGTAEALRRLEETGWRVDHWFSPERTIEETERALEGP